MRTHTVTIPLAIKIRQRHITLFRDADTLCWSLRRKKRGGDYYKIQDFVSLGWRRGSQMGMAGARGAGSVYARGFRGAGFVITY